MRGKKMKHKIYLQFCLIAALAILITTTIVTALFYQRFKAQVFSDVSKGLMKRALMRVTV